MQQAEIRTGNAELCRLAVNGQDEVLSGGLVTWLCRRSCDCRVPRVAVMSYVDSGS